MSLYSHLRYTLVVVLFAWLMPQVVSAQQEFRAGDPLPQVVVDAWNKRRETCGSVYWKLKARELITAGMFNMSQEEIDEFGLLPEKDEWRERELQAWIDFGSLKVRSESRGMMHRNEGNGTLSLVPQHSIRLFDGVSLQHYQPNAGNDTESPTELWEQVPDGRAQGLVFEGKMQPFFWGQGIVFGPDTPYMANKLNTSLDPERVRIHAVEMRNGSQILVMRVNLPNSDTSFMEYAIDVEKAAAILQCSIVSKGRLNSRLDAKWSPTDHDWQPVSWTKTSFRRDGTLAFTHECTVVERVCNPDLSNVVFHMEPNPGQAYWDEATNTAFVKSPGDKPDVPWEVDRIQSANRDRSRWWWLSGIIALVVGGGGLWWYRRR